MVSRWLEDRRSLIAELISLAVQFESGLLSIKIDLDAAEKCDASAKLRKRGYRQLSEIPDDDDSVAFFEALIPGVAPEMLNSFIESHSEKMEQAQHILAKISLISNSAISHQAEMLSVRMQILLGDVDELKNWPHIEEEYFDLQQERRDLQAAVRRDLGVLDHRPRFRWLKRFRRSFERNSA